MDYKKNNKISLRNNIIINFSLLMAIIIIILALLINGVFKSEFKKYIYKNTENEIKNIDTQLIDSFYNNSWDIKDIEFIGDKALDFGIILKVYDTKNNLIWNMVDYKQSSCHSTLNNIESNMKKMHPNWNGNYIENKSPIYKDNILIGYKSVGYYDEFYYMENDLNFLNVINKVIAVIGFISICFVIIVSVVLSKRVSKPISNVSNMTKIIENGDYGKKIDYNSNIEEIHNLVSSINNLSLSLKTQENLRRRLTTDIAHELRTPLTSIQGHLEAMIDGVWEIDIKRLTIVNNEVIRLSTLVNKLRDISRVENNEDKLIKENTNLKTLIETVCSSLELDAKQKNIEISYNLDNIYIDIDKNKISQVLINIISNAIKYTNNNGSIYIKVYKYNLNTYISIKDNGVGIPKKDLNFIFERFYRVDESRSKNTGGIGVGLTISKSIVKLHGGDISVKSTEGKGSEFIIKL